MLLVKMMGTFLKKILKRIIFSFVALYTIGILLNWLDIFVPINLFSLSISSILGIPGIISLVLVYVFLL